MKNLFCVSFLSAVFFLAGCSGSGSSSGSTTATGDLQGASNAAPTTPGTQQFRLELKQTVMPCPGCGWLIDSAKLVVKHSQGTFQKSHKGFLIKIGRPNVPVKIDISGIPSNATIESADFYMKFNVHEGIAGADYSSVVEAYGWIKNKKQLVRRLYAKKDIKAKGYSKANPNVPFDFTTYVRQLRQ